MRRLSAWGRTTADQHQVIELADRLSAQHAIQSFKPGIAHGMGRSYGDVCLNAEGVAWQTRRLDHFIAFDREAGVIRCESGVLLASVQQMITKSGWMLPVTPGTQQVTVGGAIANDVHGKNHHILGTFGHHLMSLTLARTDGEIIVCGPDNRAEWFNATVGGLGLTGVILEASIRLRPVRGEWLDVETLPFQNLDEFFSLSEQSEADWEYTVAWVDCLSTQSRGIFMRGVHSPLAHAELTHKCASRNIPFTPPFSLINGLSLRAFNQIYYAAHQLKQRRSIIHYEPFFYPLDSIKGWNKLYGSRGFYQYQCVVPMKGGRQVIKELLTAIANEKMGSFLTVLKVFGDKAPAGLLSFPMHGITLALDFPNQDERTQLLFATLDKLVSAAGGRIYCAKDASMSQALFAQTYPALTQFITYRDPGISSSLSRRLFGI